MITNIVQSMQINTINKELEYKCYILQHLANIKKAYILYKDFLIEKLELRDSDVKVLSNLVKEHDDSKWDIEEFDAYRKHFYPTLQENEMVKDMKDRLEKDFDAAWEHHYKNNPHHWQYWVLVNDEDGTKALEMPEEYVIEMVCDWWAFSHKSGNLKEIFDWYKSHKKNMILHEKTRKFVEDLLDKIKKELDKEMK